MSVLVDRHKCSPTQQDLLLHRPAAKAAREDQESKCTCWPQPCAKNVHEDVYDVLSNETATRLTDTGVLWPGVTNKHSKCVARSVALDCRQYKQYHA